MNFKQWLLLTEAKKSSDIARELLGNNENAFNQIKSIIPTGLKQDLQAKLLPLAAYYYRQQPNLTILKQDIKDYADLVKLNKMQVITVNDDLTISNEFKDYLYWTEIIHGKQAEDRTINAPIPQGDLEDQELIAESPDGKIKVYKANSVNQCIILGKGESFCISQPANTMFQSYRDTKVSTFYFVYDNTRTDDLAIVVVDATDYGIELTDRKNYTASTMQDPYSNIPKRIQSNPEIYFKYLQQHGIDTSIFVNIPKNKEEAAEQKKLGKQNPDLQWFGSLTPEEKSKYIGRGHALSNKQFDYLYDNKFMLLLTQYVRTGRKITDYQLEKVAKVRDLKDKYLHNRLIADQQNNDFSTEEYELLSPKQKEEFYDVGADVKLKKAIRMGNMEKLEEAVRDGAEVDLYDLSMAVERGNFDIVKYLVGEKVVELESRPQKLYGDADMSAWVVITAAYIGRLDILKFLVENGAPIHDEAIYDAISGGHLDVVEYLVGKGVPIDDGDLKRAASGGHLDVVKYLLGDEVKDKKGNILKLPDAIEPAKISNAAIDQARSKEVKDYLIRKRAEQRIAKRKRTTT